MPCYHFTYHSYGSWMPDEDDGYVTRKEGKLPQDTVQAVRYRSIMTEEECLFDECHQRSLIDEMQIAATKQDFRLHFVATEPNHLHVLVSWKDDRPWMRLRISIKQSLSIRLSREFFKRHWLSEGGSRRRVVNQEHFDYLVCTYFPEHGGWKWCEERGLFK